MATVSINEERRVQYLADLLSVTADPDHLYSAKEVLSTIGKMSYMPPRSVAWRRRGQSRHVTWRTRCQCSSRRDVAYR